jgi:hypothetical protein
VNPIPADERLRAAMLCFDWETMAPLYDAVFEQFANQTTAD